MLAKIKVNVKNIVGYKWISFINNFMRMQSNGQLAQKTNGYIIYKYTCKSNNKVGKSNRKLINGYLCDNLITN